MSVWAHGYNVEVPYTFGYYRETSPLWVKWACLLGQGRFPVEKRLRVLELGCGQGFNLCLHAACFPEMEFLGIDIMPAHIVHGRALAEACGLKNITFLEGDFLELKDNWPKEFGSFHYVILHGIWSWVSKPVRAAIVEILRKALAPGGVVYLSYNALPGWFPGSIIRETLSNYYRVSGKPHLQAIEDSIQILQNLEKYNALIFRAYPNLKSKVETAASSDKNYLVHEYLHDVHKIFWVYEVFEEVAPAKLNFVATATLPENYLPAILPDEVNNFINGFTHPVFRQFLIDLWINQSFRRDVFQKGNDPSVFTHDRLKDILSVKFFCVEEPPEEFKFNIAGLEMIGQKEYYQPLVEVLSLGPKSVGELLKMPQFESHGLARIIQALTFLLHQNLIYFYKDETKGEDIALRFNKRLIRLCAEGKPYRFLASQTTGMGIPVTETDLLILSLISDGVKSLDELVRACLKRLKEQGRSFVKDGKVIEDPEEEFYHAKSLIANFLEKKLKKLKAQRAIV